MSVALQSIVIIIIFFPSKGMYIFTACLKNCGPFQFRPSAAIYKQVISIAFLAKSFSAPFEVTRVPFLEQQLLTLFRWWQILKGYAGLSVSPG